MKTNNNKRGLGSEREIVLVKKVQEDEDAGVEA